MASGRRAELAKQLNDIEDYSEALQRTTAQHELVAKQNAATLNQLQVGGDGVRERHVVRFGLCVWRGGGRS